ncbi:MAG: TonB-dependent receptor [Campylobacteraceae bacterium]|jgi:outer membrane receptor for ferrienterochelin and colicins|nr:TonB-dependent receptor [Campylobacteraceae bacterium]
MKERVICCAFAASTCLASLGYAQTNETVELDEIKVVSASGYEQKIAEAPASISVITSEELQKKQYITLLDAVRDIEGVDIGETRDKGGEGTISIRGMGSDYTLLLINGRRQNNVGDLYQNNVYVGSHYNHLPPVTAVERIEVIRGPMSTLYGSDAIGGVINIITKKITPEWSGSVSSSLTLEGNSDFGDDRTTDFNIMGPIIKNRLAIALRGSIYKREASNPNYEPVTDPNGVVHERTLGFGAGGRSVANTNWEVGTSLAFSPHENHEFTFDYDISKQKYDNSESQVGTLDSISSIWRAQGGKVAPRVGYASDQRLEREQYGLSHTGKWGILTTETGISQITTNNYGRSLPFSAEERQGLQGLWDSVNGNMTNLTPAQKAELEAFLPRPIRTLESNQLIFDHVSKIPLESNYIIIGGQFIDASLKDGIYALDKNGSYTQGDKFSFKQFALFAEDTLFLTDTLSFTGGARYDHHDNFGSHVSPRIYFNYEPFESWAFKGGVSTGYKTPKATDLQYGITGFGGQGTSPWIGNPDLKPEKSVNSEIALYYNHAKGHGFNFTFFVNKFKDKIVSSDTLQICTATVTTNCVDIGEAWADVLGNNNGLSRKQNISEAEVKGFEVAGKFVFTPQISLRVNYTYIDSEQTSGKEKGRPLTSSAKHKGNVMLDWAVTQALSTNLALEIEDKRYRGVDANGDLLYYKGYEVLNLGASYKANENIVFHARINNLLDKDFTSYKTVFTPNGSGGYNASFTDDYNLKAKSRNFWLGVTGYF